MSEILSPVEWTTYEPDPMDYRRCRWCIRAYVKDEGMPGRLCSLACLSEFIIMEDWFLKTPGAKRMYYK